MPNRRPRAFCIVVVAALLGAVGCNQSSRPPLAPVRGTVTYDGKAVQHGRIVFSPPDRRPAYGRIVDGKIVEVSSHVPDDGAPVGRYSVGITSYDPPEDMYSKPGPSLLPALYANPETSGLVVDIKAGRLNTLDLRLESP